MTRVLVTGGAGFIGSNLAEKLLARGYEVIVYDNFDNYYLGKEHNIKNLIKNPNFKLVKGDILNYDSLLSIPKVDVIFHLAAQPGVRFSMRFPEKTIRVNILGTYNVLKAAVERGIKKVVFASSSSVYGVPVYLPIDERHPTNPISVYGVSKLAAEKICKMFAELHKISVTALRFHTVYGPRQRPDMAIYKWTRQLFSSKPLTIYGDGQQTRDFTYVGDIVKGIILASETDEDEFEIYNLGSGRTYRVLDVIKILEEVTGLEAKLSFEEPKAGDVPHTHADISKASRKLGYKPEVDLREGIEKFISWFKKEGGYLKPGPYT